MRILNGILENPLSLEHVHGHHAHETLTNPPGGTGLRLFGPPVIVAWCISSKGFFGFALIPCVELAIIFREDTARAGAARRLGLASQESEDRNHFQNMARAGDKYEQVYDAYEFAECVWPTQLTPTREAAPHSRRASS